MGKLIYAANISLDGFLEDESGSFDWSVPDEDLHAFWNERGRHIGTSLYGRRMYETMRVWESDDWLANEPSVVREYAGIWREARQGRLLHLTHRRVDGAHEYRAAVRARGGTAAQGDLRLGPEHWRRGDRG